MEALHARYPFMGAARDAVEAADVDLGDVIAGEGPAVERAHERVATAIEEGRVGEPHRTPRVELLSYPVARVLVSLVDEPRLTRRYARAEAETAIERVRADAEEGTELRSVARDRLGLSDLLAELGLAGSVSRHVDVDVDVDAPDPAADRFGVDVAAYLDLSSDLPDRGWRLVDRALDGGAVTVTREELYALLREAIRGRVESGLPVPVPDAIADGLSGPVDGLRERIADRTPVRDIDAVEPALFPPCVEGLLDRAGDGALDPHSRFALATFLATIGMDDEEIVARYPDREADAVRSQLDRLRDGDGPAAYPPPSCVTMQAYGDCEAAIMDALCERIAHPLEYYERRLDGDDGVLASPEGG